MYSNTDDKTTLNLTTVDNTVNQAWARDYLSTDSSGTTMNCDLNGKGTECEATTCVFKRTMPSSYDTTDITFVELNHVEVAGFFKHYKSKDDTWTTKYGEEKSMFVMLGATHLAAAAGAMVLAMAF